MGDKRSETVDIREIRDLAMRYAQAVDRRDAKKLCELFTEDAVLDGSGYLTRGRDQFARIPPMLSKRYVATFHAVQNHLVDLDGDWATGEVYAMSRHLQRQDDGDLTSYVMIMRYHDRYVRESDGWRFTHRHLLIDWTETGPANLHSAPKS